jgi:hypothetical protein
MHTDKTAVHGNVHAHLFADEPDIDTVFDDTNACLVLDLFYMLQDSPEVNLFNKGCITNHELLEKVAHIVGKRIDPTGLIDYNTGLKR